ncbi:MAG: GDSL-type esterase/lipase family protein [Polyangiaceae bacterium]
MKHPASTLGSSALASLFVLAAVTAVTACSSDDETPPASPGVQQPNQPGPAPTSTSEPSPTPTASNGGGDMTPPSLPGDLEGEGPGIELPGDTADAGSPGPSADAGTLPPVGFSPCPTDGTPCRIMPLGDSITFGIGSSGGGYRVELFRQALANDRSITFVGNAPPNGPNDVNGQPFPRSHQGHSGFTISGGGAGSLAQIVAGSLVPSDPDVVLLMIGTNDVNGNIDLANAPQRLGTLIDQITDGAPDALLVVAPIIPITVAATNVRVEAYNAAIPALIDARVAEGKHVRLVDMYTPFATTPNFATALMNDFLHPNDAGYVVMGQTWFDAIEDVLPE